MIADEVLGVRIGRELGMRRHPLPDWLTGLRPARLETDVWFLIHVLGDGDDYLIGVTLPSDHALSALVYIDPNLGAVVKDAFVVPEPLEDVAAQMEDLIDAAVQTFTRTDPAASSYHDVVLFIDDLDDARFADRLSRAISGRGAFRWFKDGPSERPELMTCWFADDRQRGRARSWLAEEGYTPTWPPIVGEGGLKRCGAAREARCVQKLVPVTGWLDRSSPAFRSA